MAMKLSEAIRLGAMLRPQGFGFLYGNGESCARGAAYEAAGIADSANIEQVAEQVFPLSPLFYKLSCPVCGSKEYVFGYCAISHLNDDHRWTREQIADWVESIEADQSRRTGADGSAEADRLLAAPETLISVTK